MHFSDFINIGNTRDALNYLAEPLSSLLSCKRLSEKKEGGRGAVAAVGVEGGTLLP